VNDEDAARRQEDLMPRPGGAICFSLLAALSLLGAARPALAHAFGQRYDLPVPLWLYLSGAGAAVALSFVILGLFLRGAAGAHTYPRANLFRWSVFRLLAHRVTLLVCRLASVGLFVLVVLCGFLGDQHPLRNLAPTLVWIIWWVGLAYVSALAGNLWALINPWKATFGWAEALYRRVSRGGELSLNLAYPERLGAWPAVLLLLAFAWVELVFPGSAVPARLGEMSLGYALLMWVGMYLFGRERWLTRGDAFSVAFDVLARFAPTEVRVLDAAVCEACRLGCRNLDGECINCYECFQRARPAERQWNLRPWAVGLLRPEPMPLSMMVFVLLLLSTVTFDGFMATPAWSALSGDLYARLPELAGYRIAAIQTVGLLLFPLLFLGVYLIFSEAMALASGGLRSGRDLAPRFAFTLVPIAIGYHLAHYLTYLLIQGQRVIPLLSDPFGFGWNLLGTAGYRVDIGVVGARFAWYSAVVAIVVGHILAVYLAHVLAVRSFTGRTEAVRSQYPMLALMVGYTAVSLWILAQPIVEREVAPAAATEATPRGVVRIPADARIPSPGTGTLRAVEEGKTARVRITYRLLSSAFHDGTTMTVADLLYPYVFAYRWGARGATDGPDYDPAIDRSTAPIRERLAGVRVVGVDKTTQGFGDFKFQREIPVIEVYLNSSFPDASETATIAPPWSNVPWHLIVLMEEAVRRGWAAFSPEESERKGVEWLDLARGQVKDRLAELAEEFERRRHVPESLAGLVTPEEAKRRWAALRTFYRERRHFLVTNGPYILKEWTGDSAVLQVFRDLTYPLGVGSFDAYTIPRKAYIVRVERRESGLEIAAEIEKVQKFMRSYALIQEPFKGETSGGTRPDAIECRYVIVGAAGEVVKTGATRPDKQGIFRLEPGSLPPGRYTILATLVLNDNSVNPDVRRIEYVVPGGS
jgi:hypothetical protein